MASNFFWEEKGFWCSERMVGWKTSLICILEGKKLTFLVCAWSALTPSHFLWAVGKEYFVKHTFIVFMLWCVWDPECRKKCVWWKPWARKPGAYRNYQEYGSESTFLSNNKIRSVSYKAYCLLSSTMWHLPLGLLIWMQHGTFGEGKCYDDGYEKVKESFKEQVLWCTFYLPAMTSSLCC